MGHYVEIIKYETEQTVKTMGPMSEREAEKTDRGVNINLNHEEYYTLVTSNLED